MPSAYLTTISGLCLSLFYLAGVGALAGLTGLNGPVDEERTATLLGLAAISAPLWLIHWRWLRRVWSAMPDGTMVSRTWYLQLAVAIGLIVTLVTGWRAATEVAALLLGVPSHAEASVFMFGISVVLWLYHVQVLHQQRLGTESKPARGSSDRMTA
jgi:hypothetical protein